jgi:hypothetical protein
LGAAGSVTFPAQPQSARKAPLIKSVDWIGFIRP